MCGFSHWSTAARVCASLLDWLPIGWAPVCPCRVTSFIQRLGAHSLFDHTGVHQVVVFCRFGHFSSNVQVLSSFVQETIFWITGHLSLQSGGGVTLWHVPTPWLLMAFPSLQPINEAALALFSQSPVQWYHMEAMQGSLWRCLSMVVLDSCLEGRRRVPPPELQVDLYPSLLTGGPVSQSAYRWTCIPVC